MAMQLRDQLNAILHKGSRHLERAARKHGGSGHGTIPQVPVLCTDGNQSYIQIAEDAGVIHKRLIISNKKRVEDEVYVSALESASVFPKISSSHLKSITSSLDFHYDHSRTC